jgi:hypothetical protein
MIRPPQGKNEAKQLSLSAEAISGCCNSRSDSLDIYKSLGSLLYMYMIPYHPVQILEMS